MVDVYLRQTIFFIVFYVYPETVIGINKIVKDTIKGHEKSKEKVSSKYLSVEMV